MNNNLKRITSALLAATIVFGATACNNDSTAETTTADADGNTAATEADTTATEADDTATEASSDSMDLVWMSHYDLNPTEGQERSAELAMFEDQFGGSITYEATTWDNRFDDLAAAIISGQSPDLFPYEWIAFPNGVMKNQYKAVDEIVDFTDPLWSGMAAAAEGFVYNGKHYVAPITIIESLLLIYDKRIVEDEGYDDPYELYQAGEWDWDALKSILSKFCDNGDDRIGLVNAFGRAIVQSTGETFVTYENGEFINNIHSPNIDRAQAFLSELAKEGLTGNGEYVDPAQALKDGKILFVGSGNWDIKNCLRASENQAFAVPMPQDPQADKYYGAENLQATMWVQGSNKTLGVKTWFECNRTVATDPEYQETAKQTLMANNSWTEEIYNAVMSCRDEATVNWVFDYGYGVSDSLSKTIEDLYNICCFDRDTNTGWANIRDTYSGVIDGELDALKR